VRNRVAACLGVLVPACFQPVYDRPACGPNQECPPGLTCRVDNICEPDTMIDAAVARTDAAVVDVRLDAALPPDAQACFGTFVRVCFSTAPSAAVLVDSMLVIDTNNALLCDQTNDQASQYCVIAGTSITIAPGATLRAFGAKPLLLISTVGMFDLSGNIDVSSKAGANVGAGGNSAACVAGAAATMTSGGAGGSFGGRGGDGKTIDGVGGLAAPGSTTFPTTLRGGCQGGAGAGDPSGSGGNGGGAVAIVAPRVAIGGRINASGAGGHGGGAKKCGGGGGGSGGMIVIESPAISLVGTAAVFATGGGGAQGG
jgi:hypothetical protein